YACFQDVADTLAASGAGAANAGDTSAAVEIVTPDVVAVTESAALFYSTVHGLLLIDLTQPAPAFQCALQLPGNVDQFFFHGGHLIAMTKGQWSGESHLLHFTVNGTVIDFTEDINLGTVNI